MLKNLNDMIQLVDKYYIYLINKGVPFTSRGFPIFDPAWFIKDYPDNIVPFYQRNSKIIKNKEKTMICFFSPDIYIYRRYEKVLDEIKLYKGYMGVICGDVTVTADMDIEWQNFIMLINQLFSAILAVNGIKVAMNTRRGSPETISNFDGMPRYAAYATSFLGCSKQNQFDTGYLAKVLRLYPRLLILYGKRNKMAESQLNNMGINYRIIPDFHSYSKEVRKNGF